MEKILRIEECTFKKDAKDWNEYDGWQIITDLQTIKVGISNSQSCCESCGYLITNDEVKDFFNTELKSISIVDESLLKREIPEIEHLDEGNAMFVNFETSNGTLQFVCYNSHNGYYGHDAVVLSKEFNHEQYL